MESALTPREIQARIRSGESVAEVAQAAGVPVERISAYAGPVLAEREYATVMAREAQVRRRGEAAAQRHLGDAVVDALDLLGVTPEQTQWDAWRDEDRRWTVQVSWPDGEGTQQAHFRFDQRARFSTAIDQSARDLIDDHRPAPVKQADPDSEPTIDLNDELAIVRVVQDDTEPPVVVPDAPSARIIKLPDRKVEYVDENDPDDYSEPELEQVDGVYDIIPNPHSDMDVLYDMLAGFNEDSVRIYTGLTQPVAPGVDPTPEVDPEPEPEPRPEAPRPTASPETPASRRRRQRRASQPEQSPAPKVSGAPVPTAEPPVTIEPKPSEPEAKPRPKPGPPPAAKKPEAEVKQPEPAQPEPVTEPQQDALVEEPEPKPAARPRKNRKRASVPTWDEIMFGGPTPNK